MEGRIVQNLKLLYLKRIFEEKTDENHPMSIKELKENLCQLGIKVTEQTLRSDIKCLIYSGMDILMVGSGKNTKYYLGARSFELAELKMLSDCIQSSRSISPKKSAELIRKIEELTSIHESKSIQKQIFISGRSKTSNERIWYNVDEIHKAIDNDKAISFQYLQWNLDKKLEYRHHADPYIVSPWSLIYDDDCYYLVAFDHKSETIRHYRVDKMKSINCIEHMLRRGQDAFGEENLASYSKRHFGMYGGKTELVTLRCKNEIINVILDRFGDEVELIKTDENSFEVKVKIVISDVFIGWLLGLGDKVQLTFPDYVIERIKEFLKRMEELYQ